MLGKAAFKSKAKAHALSDSQAEKPNCLQIESASMTFKHRLREGTKPRWRGAAQETKDDLIEADTTLITNLLAVAFNDMGRVSAAALTALASPGTSFFGGKTSSAEFQRAPNRFPLSSHRTESKIKEAAMPGMARHACEGIPSKPGARFLANLMAMDT